MYRLNILGLFRSIDNHLNGIKEAEKVSNLWKSIIALVGISILLYGCMGALGIGSNLILDGALAFSPAQYESSKFWFMIGRIIYGAIYAVLVVFVPAAIFNKFFGIEFRKLVIMQSVVLAVVLVERLTWIPLVLLGGLDWYVSPFSFGIIASLLTKKSWLITFFGIISIFQLWVIWFQTKFIANFFEGQRRTILVCVIILNVIVWWMITLVTVVSPYVVGRWFV